MAASQGGESRNGGRGPGERGWGRIALRGGGVGGGSGCVATREVAGENRPCAEKGGWPALLTLRETARDQVSNKSPRAGPAVRRWARSGRLSRAAQGSGGVGAAPPAAGRLRAGERSARGDVSQYTPLPREEVSRRSPRRLGRAREAAKVPQPDLSVLSTRCVTLGKSLPFLGLVLPSCKTKALRADVVRDLGQVLLSAESQFPFLGHEGIKALFETSGLSCRVAERNVCVRECRCVSRMVCKVIRKVG